MSSRIGYFINQYLKVSHSFIRRDILALERQRFEVQREARHAWDCKLVDGEDRNEREMVRPDDYAYHFGFDLDLRLPLRSLGMLTKRMTVNRHPASSGNMRCGQTRALGAGMTA